MTRKKIVIIGAGYAGFEIAKALDSHADITLIEPREAFIQAPATIRALLEPALLDQLIVPYDRLLQTGKVVQGRAVSITDTQVTIEGGESYPADYIVIATGSSYAAPFKPAGDSIADFRAAHAQTSSQIDQAQNIAIIGAGPVGAELAGEIAAARPEKSVTLISADQSLFPAYPAKLGAQLRSKLEKLGVRIILGQRAQDLPHTDRPYTGTVTLGDGSIIDSDLVFPVIGAKAQTALVQTLPGAIIGTAGRVKTDQWLRPSSHPNVFVAGDMADTGDAMTIVALSRQNPWLIKTLKKILTGASVENQKPYRPWKKAPILLPLGPHIGNSWIFMTLGNAITRMMKGKDLFMPKYRKIFGYSQAAKNGD